MTQAQANHQLTWQTAVHALELSQRHQRYAAPGHDHR